MSEPPTSPNPIMSPNSTKKRKKFPINIEAVFNQVSMLTASNINPPPGKILLTPKSAEVVIN